ncbi:MAG: hypothetical protein R3C39_09890 [Dehalococcoidia bacterium]
MVAPLVLVAVLAMTLVASPPGRAQAQAATNLAVTPANSTGASGTAFSLTASLSPASSGVLMRFRVVSGPNTGVSSAIDTNFAGQSVFTYVGTGGAGTDAILVFGDVNRDGQLSLGEPVNSAVRIWTGTSAGISLSPTTDTNPVGTSHTVTATLSPAQAGVLIGFRVTSGPNAGQTANVASNGSGQATFTYTGSGGAGTDTLLAFADANGNLQIDSNEAVATASKVWTGSTVVSSIALSPASATNPVNTSHTVTATISPANSGVLVRFRVISGPNANAAGASTTNGSGRATFTYAGGSTTGSDVILAFTDLNSNGQIDGNDVVALATKAWTGSVAVTAVRVAPQNDTNPTGTTHTLTATVTPQVRGARVGFEVVSGPHQGRKLFDDTNSNGVATQSYRGTTAGLDVIVVWADLDRDGVRDGNEPATTATKTWTGTTASSSDVVARARAACQSLTRADHPALPVLCSLLDQVPTQAQETIAGVILNKNLFKQGHVKAEKPKPNRGNKYGHWRWHDDDDD